MKRTILAIVGALLLGAAPVRAAERPNIVIIYADDLGYGDVGCYGATAVKTPHIDRLAREGVRFTNAHAPAATCTPSRYALLTGEYSWRSGARILRGDAPLIIEPGTTTVASMLRRAGYRTGVVGKWHLGLGAGDLDWNGAIKPGPLEVGFDYCYLIPATGDRVPCVYVENHAVVGLDASDPIQVSFGKKVGDWPTGAENPELLKMHPTHGHNNTIIHGISRIGFMTGGRSALWDDETMADVIAGKAVEYIERHKDEPFFLFFSLHDPHVPRVPHPRFVGSTEMGPRGDVISQIDWCVGEILRALDERKLAGKTLVILTSDNGPVLNDGYADEAVERVGDHKPAGPLRGGKYSAFEAATRLPFVVRWPEQVKAGGVSEALVCQIDFLASFARLTGQKLSEAEGVDSFDVLDAMLGRSAAGRDHLVRHAAVLSISKGDWKYIEPGKGPAVFMNTGIESGQSMQAQLYNLAEDLGEKRNLAAEHPEKVAELKALLEKIRREGRSRAVD